MDWNQSSWFAPKIKIAARTLDKDSFFNCFEDVTSLLNVCEEGENSTSRPFIERVRISGEICWKCVTDCKWVQRGVYWGCWKFQGFVPQLVPKIDRTGAKEYSKLYSLSSISGKFTGTYSKRRTRETKERDQWRDFATLQSFGIQVERHCRTSSHFMLDPVATGRRAWYQWGNWLYNYRKYRSWW